MGTIIAENVVVRKKGFLYYINKDGDVCEAEMGRRRKVPKDGD